VTILPRLGVKVGKDMATTAYVRAGAAGTGLLIPNETVGRPRTAKP